MNPICCDDIRIEYDGMRFIIQYDIIMIWGHVIMRATVSTVTVGSDDLILKLQSVR